jgi:hypothetical protein
MIDERAMNWVGAWGASDWELLGDVKRGLYVKHGTVSAMPVLSATISPHSFAEGPSIDLMVDGLEMMLRLGWKNGVRIIDVWQGFECTTLERE